MANTKRKRIYAEESDIDRVLGFSSVPLVEEPELDQEPDMKEPGDIALGDDLVLPDDDLDVVKDLGLEADASILASNLGPGLPLLTINDLLARGKKQGYVTQDQILQA